jgi:hypothetical protein
LTCGVVQVPGYPAPLLVLQAQKLARKPPEFLFRSLPAGDVRDKATNGVYFAARVEQGKLLDNAGMRAIVVDGHLLELHRGAGLKNLEVTSAKYRGLIRWENLNVFLAVNLISREVKGFSVFFINEEVAPVHILEKSGLGCGSESR